jgi:hypothetical protein
MKRSNTTNKTKNIKEDRGQVTILLKAINFLRLQNRGRKSVLFLVRCFSSSWLGNIDNYLSSLLNTLAFYY